MAKALLGHLGEPEQAAVVAALRGRISALEAEVALLQEQNHALRELSRLESQFDAPLDLAVAVPRLD
jgi:hypothetical protein